MLKKIGLRNFLAFNEVELDLGRLTVLTGTNSAGKSSVIRALALLKQSSDAGELAASKWMLNGELVRLGTGADLLFAEPTLIQDSGFKFAASIKITDEDDRTSSWVAEANSDSDVLPVVVPDQQLDLSSLWEGGFQYLCADRAAPETTYPKSHSAVSLKGSLGARGEHTANFLRVFGHEPVANGKAVFGNNPGTTYLDQTKAWVDRLSPGSSVEVSDIPGTELVALRYPRLGQVWTPAHRATNVGYGMTLALPIIVAALAVRPGSVLIVENPEIHLHPAGQSLVAQLLAAAAAGGAQVILETHSDHVLNSLRIAVRKRTLGVEDLVINFFHRNTEELAPGVTRVGIDDRGRIDEWPEGFFDQIDKDLSELIS